MTFKSWTDAIEGGFTEADFKLFSDLFEVRVTSSQSERISFSQSGFGFEDPQPNGPVEDMHFSKKIFNRNSGRTTFDHLATFLKVSDFEELCLSLCSLAKKHHFNVDKMMADMEEHPEDYSCNEVLISN